jgi:diguanylate cyclase (GGDEF)-like protein/PAS domain S-box-containing protein
LLPRIDWSQRATKDAAVIFIVALATWCISEWLDFFATIEKFQSVYGDWGLDDLIIMCAVLCFALTAYTWRRRQDIGKEIQARRLAEAEVAKNVAQLTRTQTFLNSIIENVPATIFVRELPEGRFVLINREGERFHGVPRDDLLGKTAAEVLPATTARIVAEHDKVLMQSAGPVVLGENSVVTQDRGVTIAAASGIAIPDADGKPKYLLNVVQDVTDRRRAEAEIEHLAHFDALTDLPNRAASNLCLEATVEHAAAAAESFAVMCIDLDRFKEVNDVFGHSVGDGLLRAVADRLRAVCDGAFLARLSGDEFTVICTDGPQPAAAEALAARVLHAVDGDIVVDGHTLRAAMSVGVAVYPADGADASVLLAHADAALYRAKAEGRGSIRFFEPDMDKRLRDRRALQHDLRSALSRGEFMLYYQPQASIDGDITGFEALVRWKHPTRGMVSPGDFIPLAEESGLIMPLGEWILREACREAASWSAPLSIAVNFSPVQFRHGDLTTLVHTVLLETGLSARRLVIEITEGVLIADFSRAVSILRRLKTLGVRIAMDDFGTGYSSLSYLQAFPFDKIKVDQAFIANLHRNPQSAAIIRAVIGLGRGLDLPVAAEGVETKEQLAFLERERCDEVQGYLIGRPAPIAQYAQFTCQAPVHQTPVHHLTALAS